MKKTLINQIEDLKKFSLENDVLVKTKTFKKPCQGKVVFWCKNETKGMKNFVKGEVPEWQLKGIEDSVAPIISLAGKLGPVWILKPGFFALENEVEAHGDKLKLSRFGRARDLSGQWVRQNQDSSLKHIEFHFVNATDDDVLGAFIGIQLARYTFLSVLKNQFLAQPKLFFTHSSRTLKAELKKYAEAYAWGMNAARHLTNLPANALNPHTFSNLAKDVFKSNKNVKVEVWDQEKLEKESMGLLLGVGEGALHKSAMVHIKIRGQKSKPVAFVGKGITFDTGGLDIKPSSGMRLMKKDMAGAAVVFGLGLFAVSAKLNIAGDFYLALAENAVSDKATRPGDVHKSRNGYLVEIHNTDAEGRLAMADVLDVAIKQKDKDAPEYVIDCSTLTGAMRVALGLDVAGYFSNDDKLADILEIAATRAGEMIWRLPLIKKYFKSYASKYADFMNASDSSYAGAITAALFLQKFVGKTKWAHFDMMAWNMAPEGALSDGGNAQTFQTLAHFLSQRGKVKF
jgi:leucyl aminopeptidase